MSDKKPSALFLHVMRNAYPEIDGTQYYVELYGHCGWCDGVGRVNDELCENCDGMGAWLDLDNVRVCLCGRETVNFAQGYPTCTRCDDSRQVRKPKRKNYPDRYERILL